MPLGAGHRDGSHYGVHMKRAENVDRGGRRQLSAAKEKPSGKSYENLASMLCLIIKFRQIVPQLSAYRPTMRCPLSPDRLQACVRPEWANQIARSGSEVAFFADSSRFVSVSPQFVFAYVLAFCAVYNARPSQAQSLAFIIHCKPNSRSVVCDTDLWKIISRLHAAPRIHSK